MYVAIILFVLSASIYFFGWFPTVCGIFAVYLCAKGAMRIVRIVPLLVVVGLAEPAAAQPCLETGDCELASSGLQLGCLGSDSSACRWDAFDYGTEASFAVLQLADWLFTSRARDQHRRGWYETNPVMGRHPSQASIASYFVLTTAAHAAIAAFLPRPWRTIWQGLWIGFGLDTMLIWGGSVYFPF